MLPARQRREGMASAAPALLRSQRMERGGATDWLAYFLCRSPDGASVLRVTWIAINLDITVVTFQVNVTSRTKWLLCRCTCQGELDNLGWWDLWDYSGKPAPQSLLSIPPVPTRILISSNFYILRKALPLVIWVDISSIPWCSHLCLGSMQCFELGNSEHSFK